MNLKLLVNSVILVMLSWWCHRQVVAIWHIVAKKSTVSEDSVIFHVFTQKLYDKRLKKSIIFWPNTFIMKTYIFYQNIVYYTVKKRFWNINVTNIILLCSLHKTLSRPLIKSTCNMHLKKFTWIYHLQKWGLKNCFWISNRPNRVTAVEYWWLSA